MPSLLLPMVGVRYSLGSSLSTLKHTEEGTSFGIKFYKVWPPVTIRKLSYCVVQWFSRVWDMVVHIRQDWELSSRTKISANALGFSIDFVIPPTTNKFPEIVTPEASMIGMGKSDILYHFFYLQSYISTVLTIFPKRSRPPITHIFSLWTTVTAHDLASFKQASSFQTSCFSNTL